MSAPREPLVEALAARTLLLDGAMGTALCAARPDLAAVGGLERLNAEDPARVRALHAASLAAGCDALRTNSFCGSAPELAAVGLGGRARELARRAAELSRAAADAAGGARFVLGSVGPGRGLPAREGRGLAELVAAERDRARGLAEGGVDAFLIETARDPLRVEAAAAAAREAAPALPVLAAFTVEPDGRLAAGADMNAVARLGERLGLALLGLNCAGGPASLDAPLAALRAAWAGPLGAWPNAGLPAERGGAPAWPVGPEALAAWLAARTAELDLRLVGGCCGAGPAHVAAAARALGR